MRGEPCLDVAATLCRQFIVDPGVQFVFGYRNSGVGHCLVFQMVLVSIAIRTVTCITLAITSPAAAPAVRRRDTLSHGRGHGRAATSRYRSARPGYRPPRGSSI